MRVNYRIGYNSDHKPIKIDVNNNGEIEVSEALKFINYGIDDLEISNLNGIENLQSVVEFGF